MNSSGSVFIIIPNWNGASLLRECLESILEHTAGAEYEVVVVDNGSNDCSRQMLADEFPWVKVICNNENLGFSRAINQGMVYAIQRSADLVLLLNNDIEIVEDNWLNKVIDLFQSHRDVGIIGCKLVLPNGKIQHAGGYVSLRGINHRGYGERDNGQYDNVDYVDYVTGAVIFSKTDTIKKIGLFDEGFSPVYFEETEWCSRAWKSGFKVLYTPVPKFIHKYGMTTTSLGDVKQNFYFKRNWIRFVLLAFPLHTLLKWIFLYEPRDLIDSLVARRSKNSFFPFALSPQASNNIIVAIRAWKHNIVCLRDILSRRAWNSLKRKSSSQFDVGF